MQLLLRCQVTSKSVHSIFLYVLYTNRKNSTILVFLPLLDAYSEVSKYTETCQLDLYKKV